MLVPIKQLYPIQLAAGAVSSTILETQLPVIPILHPRVMFRNTGVSDIIVSVDHVLDLGISTDPLVSGVFTTNILTTTVGPGELVAHYFMEIALSASPVRHTITLTNSHATNTTIIHMWVEGLFEESLKDPPTYLPIII